MGMTVSKKWTLEKSRTLHDLKLKATAGMSQQINSRAVVKLTQWLTKGYAPVTCVMILNDNVKLKTIMDNDTQAYYKKTMID